MTDNNSGGFRKIRRALISVSNKKGIVDFANTLKTFGVDIISTGGTARVLREAGLDVRDVSDVTSFPEMMDGRVKTLHPKIHGALLGVRDNEEHQAAMGEHGIEPIDLVVINLYPFEETIKREGITVEEAIEQIDIGGPAMIRSAAKNFHDVAVIVTPALYRKVVDELKATKGALSLKTRSRLARLAFLQTARYDGAITQYLDLVFADKKERLECQESAADHFGITLIRDEVRALPPTDAEEGATSAPSIPLTMPAYVMLECKKQTELRYGENPHQQAALYIGEETTGIARAEILGGKEMSYNNYVDGDAAWGLVCDFEDTACAIIKHTNPAGVGLGSTIVEAYQKALATDPVSAFGGIVAFNREVSEECARAITEIFTEVVIAPDFDEAALRVLRSKKNLRVLRAKRSGKTEGVEYRQISGGLLVQTSDTHRLTQEALKVVSQRNPTEEEVKALLFAWTVCKHTKSNAIVYAREGQTVGVGAGQMSRVDSVKIGAMRAQLPLKGSVLASDAFFPFRDGIDEAAKHGITAIIQPGGSMRDAEVIAAADEYGLAMVFTGIRHFRH